MSIFASPQGSFRLHLSKMLWSSKTELDQLLQTEQISPASRAESTLSLLSILYWHMPATAAISNLAPPTCSQSPNVRSQKETT